MTKPTLRGSIERLLLRQDEHVLSMVFTVLFGFFYWQLNDALHYVSGLRYGQLDLSKSAGETVVDPYMGIAQVALLAPVMATCYVAFRTRTAIFCACILIAPAIVNGLLFYWRERPSTSAFAFSAMNGMVLVLLVQSGLLRRRLLDIAMGLIHAGQVRTELEDIRQEIELVWNGVLIASGAIVLSLCAGLLVLYVSPEDQGVFALNPSQRQALAVLFIVSSVWVFVQAYFLVGQTLGNSRLG